MVKIDNNNNNNNEKYDHFFVDPLHSASENLRTASQSTIVMKKEQIVNTQEHLDNLN